MSLTPLELLFLVATLSVLPALRWARRVWAGLDHGARVFTAFLAADLVIGLAYVLLQGMDLHPEARRFSALALPVEKLLLLFALAAWQVDRPARRVVTGLGVLALLFWVPAVTDWREPGSLGPGLVTVQSLIILTVGAFLIARRRLTEGAVIAAAPWFWFATGVVLFYGSYALLPPLTRYLAATDQAEQLGRIAVLRSLAQIGVNLLFLVGYRRAALPPTLGLPSPGGARAHHARA